MKSLLSILILLSGCGLAFSIKPERTNVLRFKKIRTKPQKLSLDDSDFLKHFAYPPKDPDFLKHFAYPSKDYERVVKKKPILASSDLSTMTGIMTGTELGTGTMTATGSDRDPSAVDDESDTPGFDMAATIPVGNFNKPFLRFNDSRRKNRFKQKYKNNKIRSRNQAKKTYPGQDFYIRNLDYYEHDYPEE